MHREIKQQKLKKNSKQHIFKLFKEKDKEQPLKPTSDKIMEKAPLKMSSARKKKDRSTQFFATKTMVAMRGPQNAQNSKFEEKKRKIKKCKNKNNKNE